MEVCNACDDKTECDNITALELQKSKRILYFSDGIMEELSDSEGEDIGPDITDRSIHLNINVHTLPLGSRIKYQAYQIASQFLNGVDYVGESLANFFGITAPKYINESDIDQVTREPQTNNLNHTTHNGDGSGWHNNKINSSNIVIPRTNAFVEMTEVNSVT